MKFVEVFQNVFHNAERRLILLATIGVASLIAFFMCFDMSTVNRIFYKPEQSLLYNIVNFVGVMCTCFTFGFVFSRLMMWVKSGSFKAKKDPAPKHGKRNKRRD